jgi:hypothetical protein
MTIEAPQLSVEELQKNLNEIEGERPAAPSAATNPLYLRDFVEVERLKLDCNIDLSDLDNAVRQQASLYVHYADLARQARRQHERMKVTAEVMESKLYHIHRTALLQEGVKPTKDQVDAAVRMDPRWYAAMQKVIDAKAIMDLAVDAREALSQRKDMLVQITVDRRREMEGQMRVMNDPVTTRNGILAALAAQQRKG